MNTFQKTEYKTEWDIQIIQYSCDWVKFVAQKEPGNKKWMIIKVAPERTTMIELADDKEQADEILKKLVRRYEQDQKTEH